MAEQDRAPMIQLPIDQEVYMDSVHEGTEVLDATVATEIVSFERIGDAYVLEGAVVFAGYVSNGPAPNTSEADGEDKSVEHIHQRLPFILRVPIHAQQRGILNVKSRLSGWKLSVASQGWLRVQGELQVAGLSSQEGYHFECGGQQLGHPMFDMQFRGAEEDESFADETGFENHREHEVPEKNEHSNQLEDDSAMLRHARASNTVEHTVEMMSEARGGHGLEENQGDGEQPSGTELSTDTELNTDTRTNAENVPIRAADELEKFDRFFVEKEKVEEMAQDDVQQKPRTVAEFEFEHQLSPEEMIQFEEASPAPKAINETFVASRSFLDEGFHAAAGFAHRSDETESENRGPNENEINEEDPTEDEVRSEAGTYTDSLWSFVDFNAPERKHTLRYIIVMEEETLETVAERIHCTKSELIRVNKLEVESIEPGQTLLVPEVPFTFAK
jgi:hypothetical protein